MKEQRDKYLTEAMGECWPDFAPNGFCRKCNCDKRFPYHIDFSTWQGFGKLLEWAKEQIWWDTFQYRNSPYFMDGSLVDPEEFADTLYEFITKSGELDE
jgi:hypothetical protein